ncbi:adenosylhomocysteinase 3 isoform X2, partial [Biomphalaria pfeifferi]
EIKYNLTPNRPRIRSRSVSQSSTDSYSSGTLFLFSLQWSFGVFLSQFSGLFVSSDMNGLFNLTDLGGVGGGDLDRCPLRLRLDASGSSWTQLGSAPKWISVPGIYSKHGFDCWGLFMPDGNDSRCDK